MALPEWPPRLRDSLTNLGMGELYSWWQLFRPYFMQRMDTKGDLTFLTSGKGVVLTNAAGTVVKRVRLNDAGNGLIYEDV
jgi:hypothetical protein